MNSLKPMRLAKASFGAQAERGKVVFRQRLRRTGFGEFFAGKALCLVAMEACNSALRWARELARPGHIVHLIAPARVREKNEATDGETISETADNAVLGESRT